MSKQNRPHSPVDLLKKFESAEKALNILGEDIFNESVLEKNTQTTQKAALNADSSSVVEEIVIWRKDPNSFTERRNTFMLTRNIKQEFENVLKANNPGHEFLIEWKLDVLSDDDRKALEHYLSVLKNSDLKIQQQSPSKNFSLMIEKQSAGLKCNLFWEIPLEKVVERHNAMRAVMAVKTRLESKSLKITFIHNQPLADMSNVIGFSVEMIFGILETVHASTNEKNEKQTGTQKARGSTWKASREVTP
jgi:hypothetical protein